MDYDELDYDKMSHDELLVLAEKDIFAMQEFYYRYQYDRDPDIKAEARKILQELAEDEDIMGFWPDWYATLRDSDDPQDQRQAEVWKQKILDDGGFDDEVLIFYGLKTR